ncbi:AcrR family transcriptional regulator [Microbacterium ginsengiterrae]|uniref:AcrR family transcriptional regulator n=1 Tax=Microbacterium ginsengiterrae TaxID=546115 RepID=A0A7W9CE67_9MICO|nr:TetR/AcrR family transcriptional regulator [Microbacterium ginsengiterrae]MBB5743978.1 AcrR family transcriptional regulator [Microbacterium ginsengiterrae]
MPRPPRARERVLDAFERILIDDGERTATLDATAKAAGVSKGGLLYHFASKDDLAAGLLARLEALAQDDLDRMASAEEGPIAYFLRTSVMEDAGLDRALVAVSRLAQSGIPAAADALRRVREAWADALRPHVRDDTALELVMLVSDGLYYNNALDTAGAEGSALAGPVPTGGRLEKLIALVSSAAS